MIIAGKCPPEKEELQDAYERGFDKVELYLEKHHLNDLEERVELIRESKVEVVSVHTPHVSLKEKRYFIKTDELAQKLDACIVFHSQYLHHTHIPELEKLDINSNYGYENNPGVSRYALENLILGRGHNIVLDTAHLYIAEKDFQSSLEKLLTERHRQIKVIHLCDSSKTNDGLPFGEGDIDMGKTCKKINDSSFDGIVVLEVMPEYQETALEKWREFT